MERTVGSRIADSALVAVEVMLLVAGCLLAGFIGTALIETYYLSEQPIPMQSDMDVPVVALPETHPKAGGPEAFPMPVPRMPSIGSLIGHIDVPSARLTAAVLEGTNARTLLKGAGHITGTPLPGQYGNVGIAGHRDTVFRRLRLVAIGDPIVLTTGNRVLQYQVSKTWIVNPDDVHVLDPTDRPALTLITCYPFRFIGPAPQRYVIRAELVDGKGR